MLFPRLFITLAAAMLVCLATTASGAAILPPEEVEALRQIAKTLGKTNWNFSVDPCSGKWDWITSNGSDNGVFCNCSLRNNTVCHVVRILLKSQSLPGKLPPEITRLPYLQELDLTRNYLNGTIPPEWGSTKLVNVSLLGNRLSGPIPKELGNITTLANLTLSSNRLSGTIPPQLGSLPRIEKLEFTSNNLSGQLPSTLSNLITLKDFRIGDNQFSGSIPNFIKNWTNLEKLLIQGSGLDGPIPPGIASLTKLTDLRISDLKGNNYSTFPPLSAKEIKTLILRSCNIHGPFPPYLSSMTKLKVLDLSFNRISGRLPSSMFVAEDADFVYLTGNLLTGSVPEWILDSGNEIDLSYNNFTLPSSPRANLNWFNSESYMTDIDSCSKSSGRPQYQYSFHINCGGKEYEVDNKHFEDDNERGGAANYFQSPTNWAVSSTGHFLDDKKEDLYTVRNNSSIYGKNSKLYMDARVSPLSLTYYGFCLGNGNYTVKLHFAEIMFTDDRTYQSLGRRVFDIYIQGKLMKEDFNIEDEAGGVNKPTVKSFGTTVIDNTLTIRFYWAGRGTVDIPDRGVYGPLISAISVDSDFRPPEHRALSAGAIAGIVIAVLFMISLLTFALWRKCCISDAMGKDFGGLDLQTGSFTLRQIKAATNNFDVAKKIGEGGFGSVYKGNLSNGKIVAVKQLSSKSQQGNREFVNEIGMISALQHPNLVKLYGCCIEANQLLLVYEYMENNSLARALFGPKEHQLKLDWPARHNVCVGMARGLAYLHEESRLKIIHRDIKATNVLLDKNLNPKISDFGLAKLHEEDTSHISTRIAGTFGYMAPEYAMRGYLTDKADVYSFGIVVLEIVSGRCNSSIRPKEERFYVLDWAHLLKEEGKLMELVDPRLESEFDPEQVTLTINVALLCADVTPDVRPSMSMVVSMLEGRVDQILISDSSLSSNTIKLKEMGDIPPVTDSSEIQAKSMSMDVPGTASSTSTGDLYPAHLNSDIWQTRKEDISLLR